MTFDEDQIEEAMFALQRQIRDEIKRHLAAVPIADVAEIMSEHHKWHESEARSYLNGGGGRDGFFDVEGITKMALLAGKTPKIVFE